MWRRGEGEEGLRFPKVQGTGSVGSPRFIGSLPVPLGQKVGMCVRCGMQGVCGKGHKRRWQAIWYILEMNAQRRGDG